MFKNTNKQKYIISAVLSLPLVFAGFNATAGRIIMDKTAVPHENAIETNHHLVTGTTVGKEHTGVESLLGGNGIQTDHAVRPYLTATRSASNALLIEEPVVTTGTIEFQTQIPPPNDPRANIQSATDNWLVSEGRKTTPDETPPLKYFDNGSHLFDLERLRSTADWLSETDANGNLVNISPDTGIGPTQTGTITYAQFMENIATGTTMYGIVRVLIGLEMNGSTYGFCQSRHMNMSNSLCHCSPGTSGHEPKRNDSCPGGTRLGPNARIDVRGTLLWDFVDHIPSAQQGGRRHHRPIPLNELPPIARDLYFQVNVPILVNADPAVADGNGPYSFPEPLAKKITRVATGGAHTQFSDIPQLSIDAFQAYHGYELVASGATGQQMNFADLNTASQFHLMIPNGYEAGWAEAFNKLNISRSMWTDLPPASCTDCAKFSLPDASKLPSDLDAINNASNPWTANHFRDNGFEDIPAYLYTGGLVDMHDDTYISGLLYIPQALELEAKRCPVRQIIVGGLLVRDGFFIEEAGCNSINGLTLISNHPTTYSTAMTEQAMSGTLTYVPTGPAGPSGSVNTGNTGNTGNAGTPSTGIVAGNPDNSPIGGGQGAGSVRWTEIKPQALPPAPAP